VRVLAVLPKEIVRKKEEKRVCNRLPRVFYYSRVKARETPLLSIDLSGSIADIFVFSLVRRRSVLA